MRGNKVWPWLILLAALALVFSSCASSGATTTTGGQTQTTTPPTSVTTTTTSAQKPQYGGSMSLLLVTEPVFDLLQLGKNASHLLSHNYIWDGDWARGPAGGYGTNEFKWVESTNIPSLNIGHVAEKVTWAVDAGNTTVTTTIKVRQGIHFALNQDSEASRLAAGRELTTDDVLFCLDEFNTNPKSQDYQLFPMTRTVKATKVDNNTITVTYPFDQFLAATMRQLGLTVFYPKEVYNKYGAAFNDPKNDVGTGPYMITDYVSGSTISLKKNPNYWETNPVGPGKGDKLPYVDNVKFYILTDTSTQQAALRTGKLDQMGGYTPEDTKTMAAQVPQLKQVAAATWGMSPLYLRTDMAPTNDVRVRRALLMATDLNAINKSQYNGLGQILSWPSWYTPEYAGIYLGLDDPAMPADVKALYTYNPDGAKALLKDAGYPTGIKLTMTLSSDATQVDYYSILKDQWSKAGINVTLDPHEPVSMVGIWASFSYKELAVVIYAPNSTWPEQANYNNVSNWVNAARVDDPTVNDGVKKAQVQAVTDFQGAMSVTKDLMKYLLGQAYCIPTPRYPQTNFWWPWVKNYDGETTVGYFPGFSWVKYIWVDQTLKKSLGH